MRKVISWKSENFKQRFGCVITFLRAAYIMMFNGEVEITVYYKYINDVPAFINDNRGV